MADYNLTMNPDTGTIPNWQQPNTSTSDPKAKKAVTELELGKMTMWAWGAAKTSLDSTHCPKYGDIVSATNNTINASGPVNGVAETSYKIISSGSPGSTDKLLKRESVTMNNVKYTLNISHNLSLAPGDYYIRLFLTNTASSSIYFNTSLTSVCTFTGNCIYDPGASGWRDYTCETALTNIIDGGNINRDAYVCLELYGASGWKYNRYVSVGVKKWNSSTSVWDDVYAKVKTTSKVNATKAHLGIKWRDLVSKRYRILFTLDN